MRAALALAFVFVGCGPAEKDPKHPGETAGQGSGVVCHEVADTGTMFTHTECTAVDEANAQRDDARRFLKAPRNDVQRPPK
jgi:hypothetical protein